MTGKRPRGRDCVSDSEIHYDTDYDDSEPYDESSNYDTECSDVSLNYDTECSDVSLNYDTECSDVSLNYDTECSDVSLNYDTECSDVSLNYDYECSDVSLNYDTECSGGSSSEVEAFVKSTDSDESSSSSSSSSSEVSRAPHGCEMESGKNDGTSEEIMPRQVTEYIQVTDLSTSEVIEKIRELMCEITSSVQNKKGLSFKIPSKYQYFEDNQIKLKKGKDIERKYPNNARKTALMARVLSIIFELCQQNKTVTKRDIYYMDKALFVDQVQSDQVIDEIACLLHCTRRSLHIKASERGLVVGDVVFIQGQTTTNCARGASIPSDADEVHIQPSDAKFILIIEKETVYMRLFEDEFYTKFSCIIITGKGQRDVGTRKFVKMLKEHLQIPVFALVDCNPYGLQIISTYAFGSKNMSYDSFNLATRDIHWLGLRPSDLYTIPNECRIPMTKRDLNVAKALLKNAHVKQNPIWVHQLEIMIKREEKAEIEALSAYGFEYLATKYLPSRLQRFAWGNQRMGEKKLLLLKFKFHVGGKFMELPFRYEGDKVEVHECYEFFASWVDFVEFIRGFHFENVTKVYQQITLQSVDGYDDLRHIYDEKTAEAGHDLCVERRGCVFFLEHGDEQSIFDIKNGETKRKSR